MMKRVWLVFGALVACDGVVGDSARDAGASDAAIEDAGGDGDGGAWVDGGRGVDAGVRDAGRPPPDDGGPIVIGEFIAAMEPNSWAEIPNSQMSTVCPDVNHYLCEAITLAWGGGAYDSMRDRLILFGGGHSDSYVNNVFAFDLGPAKWVRLSEMPSDLKGDAPPDVYYDRRVETCGLYPSVASLSIPAEWLTETGYVMKSRCDEPSIVAQLDPQQPRSTHTYGSLAFSSATGLFYNLGSSALYPSGQATSERTMAFDFETRRWIRKANNRNVAIGAASAADENGHLYYLRVQSASEYDSVNDTWSDLPGAADTDSYYAGAAVDTTRHELMLTSDGVHLQRWKLSPRGTREVLTSTGLSVPLQSQLAFEYDSKRSRYFAWSGTTWVHWLDPQTLTWTSVDGAGADPGAHPTNGIYGRMRYSAKYDVYVLVRAVNANVMLYKPATP